MKKICEACGDEFEPDKFHPDQIYCEGKCYRTAKRYQNKAWLREILAERGCARCGTKDPIVLDFHHRDPKQKGLNLSRGGIMYAWERIEEELAKCDVLCANCHRRVHREVRQKHLEEETGVEQG